MPERITRAAVARMHDTPTGCNWPRYRKRHLTQAMRMNGSFTVETREGVLTCPDGYLALDSQGWPYPIAADEFDAIYEPVDDEPGLGKSGDDEPDEVLAALPEYDEPYKPCPNGCGRSMPPWRYGPCQLCCWEASDAH